MKRRLKWMRLDNAAKIYPAARRKNWLNIFRVSVTLTEDIDPEILQKSLNDILRRFPSICVKIRAGLFWYYIEEVEKSPEIALEESHPCAKMNFAGAKKCAFRVLYYKNRISTEFFHSLTDGTGAMIFLKTLTARYLTNKYGVIIPAESGVADINKRAGRGELEDSFLKYTGKVASGRKDTDAFIIKGTHINEEFTPLITGVISVDDIRRLSKQHNVSITTFLASVMIDSLQEVQNNQIPKTSKRKPVKVLIPVNLRNYFPSESIRNFALYITPGITPEMGSYSFDEIIKTVHHQMGFELTDKQLRTRITTNVNDEKNIFVKAVPLFIKNFVMKAVYNATGEKKSCICLSNMGNVQLPDEMKPFVERFDFILTPQAILPCNCSVVSYNGKMMISFVRNIKETELERIFFTKLVKLGVHVKIESNTKY